jgi:hypothetical protein
MHIDVQNIRGGQNFGEDRCRVGMYDNVCDMNGLMMEKRMGRYGIHITCTNQK